MGILVRETAKKYYNLAMEVPDDEHFYYHFQISQNLIEMQEVIEYLYINNFKSSTFVEIGSYQGGSLWIYGNLLIRPKSIIHVIEPLETRALNKVCDKLKELQYKLTYYKKHSYEIVNNFKDESIDLLHIDGLHDYINIKRDWDLYYPKVRKGGIIILHDTFSQHEGPPKLIKELESLNLKIKHFTSSKNILGISVVKK